MKVTFTLEVEFKERRLSKDTIEDLEMTLEGHILDSEVFYDDGYTLKALKVSSSPVVTKSKV